MKKLLVKSISSNYAIAGVVIPFVNNIMCSTEVSDSDAGVMKMKIEMIKITKEFATDTWNLMSTIKST